MVDFEVLKMFQTKWFPDLYSPHKSNYFNVFDYTGDDHKVMPRGQIDKEL